MTITTAALRLWIDVHAFALWSVLFACACSVSWQARRRLGRERQAGADVASRTRGPVIAGFGAMLVFAVLAWLHDDPHRVGAIDRALPWVADGLDPRVLDGLAVFTRLGDPGWLAVVALVGAAWLAVRGCWRVAVIGVLMAGANGVLVRALKLAFERGRPESGAWLIEPGWSFPSGHAAAAFMVYGALAWMAARRLGARQGACLAAATASFVVMIGVSRVLLGVHYTSDVLAGFALGAAHLAMTIAIINATGQDDASYGPRPGSTVNARSCMHSDSVRTSVPRP